MYITHLIWGLNECGERVFIFMKQDTVNYNVFTVHEKGDPFKYFKQK